MIGKTINNYLIERKLGEGGMGVVYYARHNKVDREVAIKVLHGHLFQNELIHNRFKNEANALIKLVHPNIVKIYDYVEHENFACLIMEYINGFTLDIYLNEYSGPLPSASAVSIMSSVLDAVQYAHDSNIFHRDIKPSNIMISKDGSRVLIMDFGIAKLTDSNSFQTTHANTQLGTPFYMSPEQIKGLPYTRMSDIYSLGVTFFEMVTGKCPYQDVKSLFELQSKIVNEPLPLTSSYYPNVSPRIQNAITKATQKTPEARFRDCNEFRQFIQDFSSTTIGSPSLIVKKPAKKNKTGIILLGVILMAVLVITVVIINSVSGVKTTPVGAVPDKDAQPKTDPVKIKADTVSGIESQNLKILSDYIKRKQSVTGIELSSENLENVKTQIKLSANILSENDLKNLVDTLFYRPPSIKLPSEYQIRKDFKLSVSELPTICRLILSNYEKQIKIMSIAREQVDPSDPPEQITVKVNFYILDSEDENDSTKCFKELVYIKSGNSYLFQRMK
jgi:serine/threonine protein kinase